MITNLPIAVRVYPDLKTQGRDNSDALGDLPDAMLVFDCETRTDETQCLTFGSYRFIVKNDCLEEGLFYGDWLEVSELDVLRHYVQTHRAETVLKRSSELKLLTASQFLERFFVAAYKGRCLVVAFNFPFDISRLASQWGKAQGRFLGGFSFVLWQRHDKARKGPHPYRVRLAIKHIDSKRALKGFTGAYDPDEVDQIPEGSTSHKTEADYVFRGHFLDLRTLAFALTDRGFTLERACEAFGVEHSKVAAPVHGIVTPDYISYNRRDVLATSELAQKLLHEFGRHPIALQATKAYSAASIGKAYLRDMGISPILQRQPDFPKRILGYTQSTFYGGRASAHVRKVPVPVVYTDFLSMYSTVNANMGLWRFVTAQEIRVVEGCAQETRDLLNGVSPEWLLERENWPRLTGFARVLPDGDILPLRAQYGSNEWQIGINHVYADAGDSRRGLWYALPDLANSVLHTGKQPRVVEAFRIESVGTLGGLKPIQFRGQVPIDPRTQDFFRVVIEERKRLAHRPDLSVADSTMLDKSLKTLGSATSYGIFAQMDRREANDRVDLACYGIDPTGYRCRVSHPEAAGEYCFPPLASLVTSSARLMLGLLERLVTDLGGTYAMEDTDSMAIVATSRGGLVPCPGGPHRTRDGREAIKALTWRQTHEIAARFARLNPYDRNAILGSILKIEDDNFDPKTGKQRQLWCYAISAKRYALFLRDENGVPELLRPGVNNKEPGWSEHGLGHLLNPTDPNSDDREWMAQAWLQMIRKALGLRSKAFPFEKVPAVGRVTVSSPWVAQSLAALNNNKPYSQQIKPFNFLLSAQIREFGHPIGIDPERFHLIAPYESNPKKWMSNRWIDEYSGQRYRVSTAAMRSPKTVGLKTYGDVLRSYAYHPELKCSGPDGKPCTKQTVGLLQRRHVRIDFVKYVGKESNSLEDRTARASHDVNEVYTEFPDVRFDEWATKTLPIIRAMPMAELLKSGLSRRMIQSARAGRRPHPKNRAILTEIARAWRRE